MFAKDARAYIEKLIRLQQLMYKKGYRRHDQGAVNDAMKNLKAQLDFYPYDTITKMKAFWNLHRNEIKLLIPGESHRCYKKLLDEYINLQNN